MDKRRWEKINSIVDEVLQYDDERLQQKVIREKCTDPLLQSEIEEYLEFIINSEGFWEHLFLSNEVLTNDLTNNQQELFKKESSLLDRDDYLKVPKHVGSYAIIKRIARGGMGEVYLASRSDEKFHQNVALKVIRNELQSCEEAERFERERMILSSLNHPNIAKLLDGGISDNGRLYYAMEFVDGISITAYCQKNHCNKESRLQLFKQLCNAVQYAHSNFIVHRDLKPDNLLVDQRGNVKVLDFGIAKMLDEGFQPIQSSQTEQGRQRVSFNYAAPEQLTLEPVTTATDVYTLGLLLFELLTNRRPFDFSNMPYTEKEYMVRHSEPPVPSNLKNLNVNYSDADLDAIILKALRKEPSERYQSVQHMLDDIISYEKSEPVQARKGVLFYHTRKFIKRRAIPIATVISGLIAVIIFGIVYTSNITEERELARLQAQKAEQATSILIDLFEANQPGQFDGTEFTVNSLLNLGEARADNLEGYPDLKATMFSVIGQIYRKTGNYDRSEKLLQDAMDIQTELYGKEHPETLNTKDHFGLLLINMGEFPEAENVLQHVLDIRENRLTANTPAIAQTLYNLGYAKRRMGKADEAESLYQRSLEIRVNHYGDDHPLTLESLSSLAVTLHYKGKYDEAEELYRKLIDVRGRILGPNHPEYAANLSSLGALLMNRGNYTEADSLLNHALTYRRQIFGNNHPDVAITLNNLGIVNKDLQNFDKAESYFTEALEIRKKSLAGDHVNLGITKFTLAELMLQTERPDSARTLLNDAYDIFSQQLPENHSFVLRTKLRLGSANFALGNFEIADNYFRESYPEIITVHPENALERALADMRYGTYLYERNKTKEAQKVLLHSLRILQEIEVQKSARQQKILAMLDRLN